MIGAFPTVSSTRTVLARGATSRGVVAGCRRRAFLAIRTLDPGCSFASVPRRRQPRRHHPLAGPDQRVGEYAQHRQGKQRRECQRRIELRGGAEQQEAEPLARADEFPDHRADHRQRDRDLGAGDDERQRRRQLDLEENLRGDAFQTVRQLQLLRRGRNPGGGIDDDRKNATSQTIASLDSRSVPSQTRIIGANATLGTDCSAIRSG